MGGISVMVMLSVMGAVAFVILGVVALALAMFVTATVVSIVFACRAKARREQGKRLKGLAAVPIVLYAVSVPVLIWFAVVWVVSLSTDREGDEFVDFSQAVTRHDPEALQACFDADAFAFPEEGPESLAALLKIARDYEDEECASIVMREARAEGVFLAHDGPVSLGLPEGSGPGQAPEKGSSDAA